MEPEGTTNDLDDSLNDSASYYEHICKLIFLLTKVLYCLCFVASITFFFFQLFAS